MGALHWRKHKVMKSRRSGHWRRKKTVLSFSYLRIARFVLLHIKSQFRQFNLRKHPVSTANFRRIHRQDSSHCTKNDVQKEFRRADFHTGTGQELHSLGVMNS